MFPHPLIELLALFLSFAQVALAQQPVFTIPQPGTTIGGNVSSTIASTNVFQKVFSSTAVSHAPVVGSAGPRHGCTIINQGTNTMWVTEGYTTATALKANAVVVVANAAYYCAQSGVVLTGEIDITGTSADGFYAAQY